MRALTFLRARAPPPHSVRGQGIYPAPRSLPESGEDTLVQAILNLDRGYERMHYYYYYYYGTGHCSCHSIYGREKGPYLAVMVLNIWHTLHFYLSKHHIFLKLHNWNKHNSWISGQHQLFMTVFLERTEITTGEKQHHSLQSGSVRRCAVKWPDRPTVDPAPASAAEATHQTEPRVCHFHHSKARVCRS